MWLPKEQLRHVPKSIVHIYTEVGPTFISPSYHIDCGHVIRAGYIFFSYKDKTSVAPFEKTFFDKEQLKNCCSATVLISIKSHQMNSGYTNGKPHGPA